MTDPRIQQYGKQLAQVSHALTARIFDYMTAKPGEADSILRDMNNHVIVMADLVARMERHDTEARENKTE